MTEEVQGDQVQGDKIVNEGGDGSPVPDGAEGAKGNPASPDEGERQPNEQGGTGGTQHLVQGGDRPSE